MIRRFGLILCILAGLLLCGCGIQEISGNGSGAEQITLPPEPSFEPEPSPEPTPTPRHTPTPEPTVTPLPEGTNPFNGPRVPSGEPVPDEWFADAAYLGNSLTEGFYAWSGVEYGDAYASTSMTVYGACDAEAVTLLDGSTGTILEGLSQKKYGKVYMLFGINEIYAEPEEFRAAYSTMLDRFMEVQPEAVFYILSLTPVTQWKSEESEFYNMDNIRAYNRELFELAWEKGVRYIDLCTPMAGPDGYLPDDCDSDGVHFIPSYYAKWYECLKTHHVEAGE